jgi:membrane protein
VNRLRQSVLTTAEVLRATYDEWYSDRAMRLGASLAYYALFAAVPLLILATAIAGSLFSEADIAEFITEQLESIVSDDIVAAFAEVAASIAASGTVGNLTTLGVVSGILGGSVIFLAFQDTLSIIWNIPVETGFRQSVERKLVAFAIVLAISFALAAALLFHTIVVLLGDLIPDILDMQAVVAELLISVLTLGVGIATLAALFQLLVRKRLDWTAVLVASTVVILLLIVGNLALGVYFDVFGSASVTGVLGSMVVLLLWLYLQAQIVVVGAELLKVLDARRNPATAG